MFKANICMTSQPSLIEENTCILKHTEFMPSDNIECSQVSVETHDHEPRQTHM